MLPVKSSRASLRVKVDIEGFARFEDPVSEMEQLSHRSSQYQHFGLALSRQPQAQRLDERVPPQRRHRREVEALPQARRADLGQTR